jgi:hypothetical protein
MRWATREHLKVDRVACPWLIRKFIDPEAEFLFLPPDTNWREIDGAIVYDVPGCVAWRPRIIFQASFKIMVGQEALSLPKLGNFGQSELRMRFAGAFRSPHWNLL